MFCSAVHSMWFVPTVQKQSKMINLLTEGSCQAILSGGVEAPAFRRKCLPTKQFQPHIRSLENNAMLQLKYQDNWAYNICSKCSDTKNKPFCLCCCSLLKESANMQHDPGTSGNLGTEAACLSQLPFPWQRRNFLSKNITKPMVGLFSNNLCKKEKGIILN